MITFLTPLPLIFQTACNPSEEDTTAGHQEIHSELPVVRAVDLERRVMNSSISVSATLEAIQSAVLLPKSPGRVASVSVRVGDKVEKGTVLMTVEPSDYAYGLQDAEGVYAVAAAQLGQAEVNLERFTQLVADGSASQSQLDEILTGVELAKAQLQRAEAGVGIAKSRLRDTKLIAPFTGTIVSRNIEVGELVGGPTQLPPLMLADTTQLRAVASVSEGLSTILDVGMSVVLSVSALPELSAAATIENINAAVDPVTRTVVIEAQIENPRGLLKHGMSAMLDLEPSTDAKLLIPRQALLQRSNGNAQVFVLSDEVVNEREVRYAPSTDSMVPVLEGLQENERVIVAGHARLKDGEKVREMNE